MAIYFVRTASEKDLPGIRSLLVAAYEAVYTPLHGAETVAKLNASWNAPETLRACIKDPQGEFLVADSGKEFGGIAYACPSRQKPKAAALVKLYVDPDLQGQGIGRDLLAEIETCFPKAESLRLQVDTGNAKAIGFYEAHGFATVGRTENCGSDESGIPALIMEKPLTPHPL